MPVKPCPRCGSSVAVATKLCRKCGHLFGKFKHPEKAPPMLPPSVFDEKGFLITPNYGARKKPRA